MLELSQYETPADTAMGAGPHWYERFSPRIPLHEIKEMHMQGLTVTEDGDTESYPDAEDEIPFGWHVIEADDMSLFLPGEVE